MVLKTSALSPAENKGGKDTGSLCLPTEKEKRPQGAYSPAEACKALWAIRDQ